MKVLRVVALLGFILGIFTASFALEPNRLATISEISGKVEVKIGAGKWTPAQTGMSLTQGDAIRTKAKSSAILDLDGPAKSAKVEMGENSQMTLAEFSAKKDAQNTLLDLALGKILIKVSKLRAQNSKFEVKTPTSIVGVRGTTFSVAVEAIE